MTEIQGKSILVRVSEGSSYRESTVLLNSFVTEKFQDFYSTLFLDRDDYMLKSIL